jgi:hypothetical protein
MTIAPYIVNAPIISSPDIARNGPQAASIATGKTLSQTDGIFPICVFQFCLSGQQRLLSVNHCKNWLYTFCIRIFYAATKAGHVKDSRVNAVVLFCLWFKVDARRLMR